MNRVSRRAKVILLWFLIIVGCRDLHNIVVPLVTNQGVASKLRIATDAVTWFSIGRLLRLTLFRTKSDK